MAFKFNFTSDDLDFDDVDQNSAEQLNSSLGDLSLEENATQKVPCSEFDIKTCSLPGVLQADILDKIPNVNKSLYKRTLADVKFQMAEQDTLSNDVNNEEGKVVEMLNLNSNSDLIRGVYEGGFKTWECSLDLVEYLSQLPKDQVTNKHVLELGCGSALPSLLLLAEDSRNQVDVQDYNDQVIRYITIPNILLNTVLTIQEPSANDTEPSEEKEQEEEESESSDDEDNEEGEDGEKDQIIGESATCDAEAELPADKLPEMLQRVTERTRAFVGDWSGLPSLVQNRKYDMIITSETIYSEEALPALVGAIQNSLQKPDGVW
ncbi:hypothetical protein BDA99DRAFT_516823 [Phascolomyces articulosus]|uniref:protein-histidine N-methyltransferase n=1 Tax=Phascolomyces articulosus TaxID=60185 RepID=A0AAD5PC06_9FUNG|nr:hypothetical protein BDA99DRAFT_516823 [Phascolomyces articulosus]